MAEVPADRLAAARKVLHLLRSDPAFRDQVHGSADDERPILVATVDDTMGDLIGRFQSLGTSVMLCVPMGSSMTIATMSASSRPPDPEHDQDCRPTSTVGMFIALLWETGSVTVRINDAADVIEGLDLVPA